MNNLLQNPNFASGSTTGWQLDSGWGVSLAPPSPGIAYQASFSGSQFGGFPVPPPARLVNLTQIPTTVSGIITVSCSVFGQVRGSGTAQLRLVFYNYDGTQSGIIISSLPVAHTGVWQTRTVSAPMPDDPNITYALVDFAVSGSNGGTWWSCTNFFAMSVSNSILIPGMGYYLKLFTSQYQLSTKLLAWQSALMQPIRDLATCIQQFNNAYDIDVAIGSQLDVLGQRIGVSRTVPFQPSNGVSPILDDVTYRILLYATIAKNHWDGKTVSLYTIWKDLFPGGTLGIQDNQDMTANVTTQGSFTSIVQDLISHGFIVPRPECVQYNPPSSPVTGPFFGFDLETAVISGFDVGKWT
jgi:hypothetical protein